ncbi:amino acid adenylation domain-containing protein [Fulvivirga ulvae]|uniref:non-ribosomal peptide synthetase n=1 Tax=Fulvivirga ulvae TaxID=2904245 RepID=UPI001F2FC4CB|nr:non-ribosomal peptide synthetase [Fulvivirga ulvae]UII31864.1 amino acid adenylation domain-containing protein [Fulvivirga ulvae]
MNTLTENKVNAKYWQEKRNIDIVTSPLLYDGGEVNSNDNIEGSLEINQEVAAALLEISNENEKALYVILLSSLFVIAKKYNQEASAFSLGIPKEQNDKKEGPAEWLPLIIGVEDGASFRELLNLVKSEWINALMHQNIPVGQVSNESLHDWIIAMKGLHGHCNQLPSEASVYFNVDVSGGKLRIDWVADSSKYSKDLVCQLLTHWHHLLGQVVSDIKQDISSLTVISAEENRILLSNFSGAKTDNGDHTLKSLFEEKVRQCPDQNALIFGDGVMTYAELDQKANDIASVLIDQMDGEKQAVALYFRPSFEMICAMFGCIKAGLPYLPLSPEDPGSRIDFILKDSGARIVLTQSETRKILTSKLEADVKIIEADTVKGDGKSPHVVSKEDTVYYIYTSGTTGTPKGVDVLHQGVVNYTTWRIDNYNLTQQDVTLQVFPYHFDGFGCNLYSTLLSGATLLLMPDVKEVGASEMLQALKKHKVTNGCFTSGVYDLILSELDGSDMIDHLRFVALAGDKPSKSLIKRSKQLLPELKLTNEYGLTETSIGGTCNNQLNERNPGVIGKPNANTYIRILNEQGELQPIGVTGELYFSGDSVAKRYLNREELTTDKFIADPFEEGVNMYKTGDMARWLPGGNIEFIGRQDDQVKIRGYRVELDEIAHYIKEATEVTDAIVVVEKEGQDQDPYLIGYFVGEEGADAQSVNEYLKEALPEYMIPAYLVQIPSIPLTATGKVNKKELPKPEKEVAGQEDDQPMSAVELELAEMWVTVIDVDTKDINRSSDFFKLGGHSIKVLKLISQLQKKFGVTIELQEFFENPTIGALSDKIGKQEGQDDVPELIVDEDNRHEPFPLTDVQYAYWIGRKDTFNFGQVGAHGYFETFVPELDIDQFQQVLRKLIDNHEVLRMVVTGNGEQRILKDVPPYEVRVLDLRKYDKKEGEELFYKWREEMAHHVFSGEEWPLFDVRVTVFEDETYKIHYGTDGLVMDAESLTKFVSEYEYLYANPKAEPARVDISFRDYMMSEGNFRKGPLYLKSKEYWKARITDLPMAPELPVKPITSLPQKPKFARRAGHLDKKAWDYLQEKSNALGITPTVFLIGCFAKVLDYWSKSSHFILNLTLYNRILFHEDVDRLLGDFTSLTLLEIDYRGNATFAENLKKLQNRMWSDLEHKYFGGIEVLREMSQYHGNSVMMPVVLTSTLGIQRDEIAEEETIISEINDPMKENYAISQTPQVWIDFQIGENSKGLWYNWDCVEEVFPQGMLQDMFEAFGKLLNKLSEDEKCWEKVSLIDLPQEQEQRKVAVNDTWAEEPGCLLHDNFKLKVKERAHSEAIISDEITLTYAQVEHLVNHVAHRLISLDAKANQLVAIVMHKGWEQVVASLGILSAGAAYLPIDASLPHERIRLLLEQGEASLIITTDAVADEIDFNDGYKVLHVNKSLLNEQYQDAPKVSNQAEDLAYVIFTSGSTGMPKGVVIDHRGATNTVCDMNQRFGITDQDRVLAISSLSFDLSVYDIFGVLGAGGALVIPAPDELKDPEAWYRYIHQYGVTLWNTVPTLMQMLVDYAERRDDGLPSIRNVWMSGDWIPVNLPDRIKKLSPQVKVTSLGGATEASIWSIYYPVEQVVESWKSIPYGKPLLNQQFYVLNEALAICPDLVPGDLYIGGIGLAKGYWKDEQKTANSFIIHPESGERLYKTGDLGRYLPDGNIEFLGREDTQVKIQGYRIELGEIEAAINEHPQVSESLTIARGEAGKSRELIAYIVPGEVQSSQQVDHVGLVTDPSVTINDEKERSVFKLEKHNLRDIKTEVNYALPYQTELKLSGKKKLGGKAAGKEAITKDTLGQLLSAVRGQVYNEMPLPKYFYPSAGSLYPVQTWIEVAEAAIDGVEKGCYYLHPEHFELRQASSQVNITEGVNIHLIADLDAIEPLYGRLAKDFARIEAGYMANLLMTSMVAVDLQTTDVEQQELTVLFGLTASQMPAISLHVTGVAEGSADDDYIPLTYNERKSYRDFQKEEISLANMEVLTDSLVQAKALLGDVCKTDVFMVVKAQAVHEMQSGVFQLDYIGGVWNRLGDIDGEQLFAGNEKLHNAAGVSLHFVSPEQAINGDFYAGFMAQSVMNRSIKEQVGWCAIGVVDKVVAKSAFDLHNDQRITHSIIGGKVSAAQIEDIQSTEEALSESPEEQMRQHLQSRLPKYMIPSYFVVLEKMPLTSNGKIDRKSLPDPATRIDHQFRKPETETEKTLVEIWSELLDLEASQISTNKSFFELGGHSLKASLMMNKIFKVLNVEVPLREIFKEDTILSIADYIENELWLKSKEGQEVTEGDEFILD